jgi:hypothetical protein
MASPLSGVEVPSLQGAKVFLPNQLSHHSGRGSHVRTTDNPSIPPKKSFRGSTVVFSLLTTTTVVGLTHG